MISKGKPSFHFVDLDSLRISDADLASTYLGVTKVPCLIKSPLREDSKPSFQMSSLDGQHIVFYDYGTKQGGNMIELMKLMWNCSAQEAFMRIEKEFEEMRFSNPTQKKQKVEIRKSYESELQCKVRMWNTDDAKYWKSYGINRQWLKFANVYPVSHKIITKNGVKYAFACDRLAYAYVEFMDGKPMMKLYQPMNTSGYKWSSGMNKDVISLWNRIPKTGDKIAVCSSLKDALCLWSHTGIPCVSPQGEGYMLPDRIVRELKERFGNVYVCFDNDPPGLADAKRLCEVTGFTNVVLPPFEGGKDISDYFRSLEDKRVFRQEMKKLFK